MCTFIPLSPKLLAQQKNKYKNNKNQDCCRCREWSPKWFLQHQRSQSVSLPFLLCSKTFEHRDVLREVHHNTGCLFSGWQQQSLGQSLWWKGKSCFPAPPHITSRRWKPPRFCPVAAYVWLARWAWDPLVIHFMNRCTFLGMLAELCCLKRHI